MKIQDILPRTNVLLDIKAADRKELIEVLSRFLAATCGLATADIIIQRVLERERVVSTGIGLGVAIPHCRIEGIERSCMVAARTAEPVDFDAIDELPVRVVFLTVSPANTAAEHSEVLKALSRVLSDEHIRRRLLNAATPDEFVAVVAEAEEKSA